MPTPLRTVVVQLALVVLPGLVALFVILHAGPPGGPTASSPAAGGTGPLLTWRLFVALALVLVSARLVGTLVELVGQPRVIGEMLAGILLGPSVLGLISPATYGWVFGPAVVSAIGALAQLGLAFFMFLVGLELDHRLLRGGHGRAATIAQAAVAVPLALGAALSLALYRDLGPATASRPAFALFLGVAMSVTAFPVLARILLERGLFHSPLGSLAMVCAAITDVLAWLLLAVDVAVVHGHSPAGAVRTLALTVAFGLLMWWVARPLLAAALAGPQARRSTDGGLALILVTILLAAAATEALGIHLVFGAFIAGAICPRDAPPLAAIRDKIGTVTSVLLLPLFFTLVGIRTQIDQLGHQPRVWAWFAVLLVVAIAGKWLATAAAGVGLGLERRSAVRLGVLMNCKGLTELVMLGVGVDLGLLSSQLFTVLVLVTLLTTVMTVPMLALLDRLDSRRPPGTPPSGIDTGAATLHR